MRSSIILKTSVIIRTLVESFFEIAYISTKAPSSLPIAPISYMTPNSPLRPF